jgi:hypothetical protein
MVNLVNLGINRKTAIKFKENSDTVMEIQKSVVLCAAYHYANIEFMHAESNFNNADPEYLDIAILELQAKRLKRDLLFTQYLECQRNIKNSLQV